MRLDFPDGTPLEVQFRRAGNRKKVGRKHDQRMGPTRYGKRADGKRKFKSIIQAQRAKIGLEIKRYWRGERETYPIEPRRS